MKKRRKPQPRTQDITLRIDTIGAGGDGIGVHNGHSVFVPKTMPDDVVRVRIEAAEKDGQHGSLLTIETPSPNRALAPCSYFNECGGCDLQHIGQEAYRAWKIAKVKTTLERAGVVPEIWDEPIFTNDATRRRTSVAVLRTKDMLHLGYHKPRSHNIISIKTCLILDPILDSKIQAMRPYLERLAPVRVPVDMTVQLAGGLDVVLTGAWREGTMFTLEQNETLAAMAQDLDIARISLRESERSETEILMTRAPIIKSFGTLKIALPPAAFLQASDEGEKALSDTVLRYANGTKTIADLFCGCGTFAGYLLANGAQVHAVDGDHAAMIALGAIENSALTTEHRNLFKEPLKNRALQNFDTVLFDPPRAGAKEQISILAHCEVPRLISVSCNPATFARDAKILTEGDYTLKSLTIIDQFVWSSHVELVGLFCL